MISSVNGDAARVLQICSLLRRVRGHTGQARGSAERRLGERLSRALRQLAIPTTAEQAGGQALCSCIATPGLECAHLPLTAHHPGGVRRAATTAEASAGKCSEDLGFWGTLVFSPHGPPYTVPGGLHISIRHARRSAVQLLHVLLCHRAWTVAPPLRRCCCRPGRRRRHRRLSRRSRHLRAASPKDNA
jgi:hypothetical protein